MGRSSPCSARADPLYGPTRSDVWESTDAMMDYTLSLRNAVYAAAMANRIGGPIRSSPRRALLPMPPNAKHERQSVGWD
jgi:hypothetical protein